MRRDSALISFAAINCKDQRWIDRFAFRFFDDDGFGILRTEISDLEHNPKPLQSRLVNYSTTGLAFIARWDRKLLITKAPVSPF